MNSISFSLSHFLSLSISQFLQESIIPLYCFCKDANERVSINSTQHGNLSYQNNTALSSSYKHQDDLIDIGIPIGEENCALLKEERVPLLLMGFMPNLFEVNFIRLYCFYFVFSLLPMYVSPSILSRFHPFSSYVFPCFFLHFLLAYISVPLLSLCLSTLRYLTLLYLFLSVAYSTSRSLLSLYFLAQHLQPSLSLSLYLSLTLSLSLFLSLSLTISISLSLSLSLSLSYLSLYLNSKFSFFLIHFNYLASHHQPYYS